MIRIAICDDDTTFLNYFYTMLSDIFNKNGVKIQVDNFTNGEELCEEIKEAPYNLLFLDIELIKMNGVEVGNFIRDTLKDENTQIVYVSSKQEYALELFESRPFNFLIKPLKYDELKRVIDKYLLLNECGHRSFSYKKGQVMSTLQYSEIMYFESSGRKITIHLSNGTTDDFYGNMTSIYSKVKNSNFLFVHKSYMLNFQYIKRYEYAQITMTDGNIIPVSQSRRKTIREMFSKIQFTYM